MCPKIIGMWISVVVVLMTAVREQVAVSVQEYGIGSIWTWS